FELIIVDDGASDDTWQTLQRLASSAPLTLLPLRHPANRGPAAARNLGWRSAKGPIVAFTDDDCVPQPGWLAALVAGMAEADIVQGRTVLDEVQARTRGPF